MVEELELDEAGRAALGRAATAAVEDVLRDLDAMRAREGGYLLADLEARCRTLSDLVAPSGGGGRVGAGRARVAAERPRRGAAGAGRRRGDGPGPGGRAVRGPLGRQRGEITRLRGHLAHWSALTGATEPCGRKLDFLLQEMNREVNTLGAKVEGADASELVVTAKAELEKLREQVQNVE